MGGKERLSFPQFVTAIARIAEEMTLKENPVASMCERLHYLCEHIENIIESKKNWGKVQKFSERLRSLTMLKKMRGGSSGNKSKKMTNHSSHHHKHVYHKHHAGGTEESKRGESERQHHRSGKK